MGEGRAAVLRFSEGQDAFSLDLVLVPSDARASGLGSMLVGRLLALADRIGKSVHTTARPIGNNTPENRIRLVRFYERFGFRVEHESIDCVMMVRPPEKRDEERALKDADPAESVERIVAPERGCR